MYKLYVKNYKLDFPRQSCDSANSFRNNWISDQLSKDSADNLKTGIFVNNVIHYMRTAA